MSGMQLDGQILSLSPDPGAEAARRAIAALIAISHADGWHEEGRGIESPKGRALIAVAWNIYPRLMAEGARRERLDALGGDAGQLLQEEDGNPRIARFEELLTAEMMAEAERNEIGQAAPGAQALDEIFEAHPRAVLLVPAEAGHPGMAILERAEWDALVESRDALRRAIDDHYDRIAEARRRSFDDTT